MRKLLDSGFGSFDHGAVRRGRPPGCRAIAAGPRLTFAETVALRFLLLVESVARWRDLLPHQRFERDQMGSRLADVVDLAAYRDQAYPHGRYRNVEEPGHS
jgi:hypothetical protein